MATENTENEPSETTAKYPPRVRKRARKACLYCRSRKVRCDVSQKGPPCMNCYLDDETCVVTGRASRWRRAESDAQDNVQPSIHPNGSVAASETGAGLSQVPSGARNDNNAESSGASPPNEFARRPLSTAQQQSNFQQAAAAVGSGFSPSFDGTSPSLVTDEGQGRGVSPLIAPSSSIHEQRTQPVEPVGASNVVYCYYPFLAVNNLRNVPPQDINFLEAQGCLRVPVKPLLDELVKQYFLRMHPILPILNEGDFWAIYDQDTEAPPADRISLLLLQAIMYASCNFISQEVLDRLGYPNIRAMKATFLRRAKLLYDMETETSALPIAQAAILLSFAVSSSKRKPDTTWLSVAIEHAKLADANTYASMPASRLDKQQNTLKRVWWGCVIRDRSIGLLMRRPIQITDVHFDCKCEGLGVDDLSDEFDRSKVYGSATKRRLAEILALHTELYMTMTETLLIAFPLDDKGHGTRDGNPGFGRRARECKLALRQWHASAMARLPMPRSDLASLPSDGTGASHPSAILYTLLMYMYYHTTRVVLCHYESLYLNIVQNNHYARDASISKDLQIIRENQREMRDATTSIISCHVAIVRLGVARWLPLPALGCTSLPLLLYVLDAKWFPTANNDVDNKDGTGPARGNTKRDQIGVLIEVMKAYQPQYDGVDWLSEILRHIVNLAGVGGTARPKRALTADWADVFYSQPNYYLRATLAYDLSLRKGRLVEEKDFPPSLRGACTVDYDALQRPTDAGFADSRAAGPDFMSEDETYPPCQQPSETDASTATSGPCSLLNIEPSALDLDPMAIENLENQIYFHLSNRLEDTDMSMSGGYRDKSGAEDVPCPGEDADIDDDILRLGDNITRANDDALFVDDDFLYFQNDASRLPHQSHCPF